MRRRYPSNEEVRAAVREALSDPLITPLDLPDKVRERLRERGFEPRLVTARRVWRIYEEMVRRGVICDVLNVLAERGGEGPGVEGVGRKF